MKISKCQFKPVLEKLGAGFFNEPQTYGAEGEPKFVGRINPASLRVSAFEAGLFYLGDH